MSFFDKILQGLGFEGNSEPKIKKEKKNKDKLVKNEYVLTTKTDEVDFGLFVPKTQDEVANAIQFIKKGYNVKIDFGSFSDAEILRAIDFFQGACFALGVTPRHLSDKIFEVGEK